MKEQVKTYPELKELISSGVKVTMNGKLMNHAKLSEIPLHEIKLFLAQGYFEYEQKTDLAVKPAIEGEFIGKGEPVVEGVDQLRQSQNQHWAAIQQRNALMQASAYGQQAATGNALSGLSVPGASLLGGLF